MLFLDSKSTLQLLVQAMCSVTMCISNIATKNHKDLRRCIKVAIVFERIFSDGSNQAKVVTLKQCSASSKVRLPNCATQTIGTNSFTIIPTV